MPCIKKFKYLKHCRKYDWTESSSSLPILALQIAHSKIHGFSCLRWPIFLHLHRRFHRYWCPNERNIINMWAEFCANFHNPLNSIEFTVRPSSVFIIKEWNCEQNVDVYLLSRKPNLTAVRICCADHATPSIRKSWHYLRRQVAVAWSV
jgi:hypothetical protein